MSGDPAFEAAQRAWEARYRGSQMTISVQQSADNDGLGALAIDAAYEALKPIRKLVDDWETTGHIDYGLLRSLVYSEGDLW